MPYLNKAAPSPEPMDCRILTAALDLFVERGFHNVSVHDVQKTANVSIGSIYKHFGGKEGIAKALYYHLLKEFEEMIGEVIAEGLTNRERCNKIIFLLFEYTETRRNIIAYMLHAKHREFLPDEPPICSSTPFAAMRNIVQQGIEEGEIRAGNPWVVAASIFGGAIRMIHLRLDGVVKDSLLNHYEEMIDCMWQGMNPEISPVSRESDPPVLGQVPLSPANDKRDRSLSDNDTIPISSEPVAPGNGSGLPRRKKMDVAAGTDDG